MANTVKQEPTPFGALLLRLRAAASLTQEQLAARAGLSSNAISALESGKRRTPRFATVELLAAALALDGQQRHELMAVARSTAGGAGGEVATGRGPTVAGTEPDAEGHGGGARDPRRQFWRSVAAPTPLVDRVHELDTTLQLLASEGVRLLTLTGPAGVGKTRLALEAAARLATDRDRFPDGVVLVDLTPIRDPALVLNSLATAVGLLDTGSRPVPERLVEVLEERQQLLVLDNFEQVLPAAATLTELLAACPGLALLATSRVPLQLRWERVLRVPPLPVPDLAAPLPPLDTLAAIPSVALFVQRARARQSDFLLTEQQAPVVARLVSQLDGLPLALELAAVRTATLPLPVIANRLGDRLRLLQWEAGDLPERQRSLEAAVGWSYDLLSEAERRLFRCLGVFVGRVSLDAIAAVVRTVGAVGSAASDGEAQEMREAGAGARTLPGLLSLAEQSLLLPLPARPDDPAELGTLYKPLGRPGQRRPADGPTEAAGLEEDDQDPEPAFALLETVREYAQEQLAAEGELAAARRAHAHYYLALAERAAPALRGPDQRAWIFRLEREHDNLRAALRWLLDQSVPEGSDTTAEREAGLRLAGALGYFWYVRGYHTEGRRWLQEILARAPQREREESAAGVKSAARTRALVAAGPLLMVQAEYARARAVLQEALALAERRQDPAATAEASMYLGHATVVAGDVAEGTQRLQEAVHRWEALGDPHGLGETLFYHGYAADVAGETAAAAAHYTAALGWLAKAGNAQHAGFVHSYLGVLEWKRGQLSSAVAHLRAVLRTSVTLRDRWLLSFAAQATVALVGLRAQPAAWARLLGAADALTRATGGATFGWEHLPGAGQVAGLRERLAREGGEGEWGAAYREGPTLPFGAVAALALTLLEEVAAHASGAEAVPAPAAHTRAAALGRESPLTEREREVLRLVAQGLSSKAIGRRLFISERTVAQHLTAVFHKLGVSTRAQAAAVATQCQLL
jgi:predicted ATPase/DNA-binding CsgD family transcriptional regulator/DNA-binding XRE family transcriptional regulator